MAKCDYCSSTILFGGTRDGDFRFCNTTCHQNGVLISISNQIADSVVNEQVQYVHQGLCPKCHGRGPVDVHTSHKIWSALLLTSWSSKPEICCRSCGRKSQIAGTLISCVIGWWGFPWGIIMTPIIITRNIIGVFGGHDELKPSDQLETMVRLNLAAQAVQNQQ